jgi:hypothetical protein
MNQEAIEKLKQFQIKNHLSGYNLQEPQDEQTDKASGSSTKKINYPKHIKPLQDRIMSAVVGSGLRTPQAIASYCSEDNIKIVNMQLGRLMTSGKLVKYTNKDSGITRYYTPDEAKAKGYKPDAQPKKVKDQSSSTNASAKPSKKENAYVTFLEKRIGEWQAESRKQAHEILDLRDKLAEARRTRDVTSEVTEVMQEVIKLRATVEYLESKLFGGK